MLDYGYLIYKDYCISINKTPLEYNAYMDAFYLALYKDNRIHKRWLKHALFILIIVIIIYYIYTSK